MKPSTYASPRYIPFGEAALIIELGNIVSLEANRKIVALDNAIEEARLQGVQELVPTYRSLLVRYDPMKTGHKQLTRQVKDVEKTLTMPSSDLKPRRIKIPVLYGGECGPDLSYVANYSELDEKEVVRLHSERAYRVYMIGFVAGFPYLGEVADEIATPRRATPRLKVPSGSVGIAEKQTGIYSCEAPGGWQIIGRTSTALFNPATRPPVLLQPGDTVIFQPVSEGEFENQAETC